MDGLSGHRWNSANIEKGELNNLWPDGKIDLVGFVKSFNSTEFTLFVKSFNSTEFTLMVTISKNRKQEKDIVRFSLNNLMGI